MASRRQARRRALEIIYQADIRGMPAPAVIEEKRALDEEIPPFAEELARGVQENLPQLDAVLGEHAEGWTVARMPAVDRAILRLACYELLDREDVPVAAVVNEAVEAAKELSTEDSGRFVNGVLGPIARMASRCGPGESG